MTQNNIEIEVKFKIDNPGRVALKLNTIAEPEIVKQYQSNVMFDNAPRIMQTTDGRIRVRTLGDSGDKVLTYKKPLPPENGIKKEVEYEIRFKDNSDQIEHILEMMEFHPTTSYERYQTKWALGDTDITMDEYPFANFLEIEGEKSEIEKIVTLLNLNMSDTLTKPCDTLFTEWRKEKGLPMKPHMRFDDFDK